MPDLSQFDSEILRFPGHVLGVLWGGSVGWWRSEDGRRKRMQVLRTVAEGPSWCGGKPSALVILARYWPEEMAKVEAVSDLATQQEAWVTCWLPLDELEIDLTDATGRAHLAWWVQGNTPSARMTALPKVLPDPDHAVLEPGLRYSRLSGDWSVWGAWTCRLDAHDACTLPDGSRLVDAIAIGIVARHVAGLPIPPRSTS